MSEHIPALDRLVPSQLAFQEMPEEWGPNLITVGGPGFPDVLLRCKRYELTEHELKVYDEEGHVLQAFNAGVSFMFMKGRTVKMMSRSDSMRFHAEAAKTSKALSHELFPEEAAFMDKAEKGQQKKTLRELGVEQDEVLEQVIARQYR
jgi:hypothetical protein